MTEQNGKQLEYISTQQKITSIAKVVKQLDLETFLDMISTAESAGSIFDPSLYIRGLDNLRALKRLALAFREVQLATDQLIQSVIQTGVNEEARKNQDMAL